MAGREALLSQSRLCLRPHGSPAGWPGQGEGSEWDWAGPQTQGKLTTRRSTAVPSEPTAPSLGTPHRNAGPAWRTKDKRGNSESWHIGWTCHFLARDRDRFPPSTGISTEDRASAPLLGRQAVVPHRLRKLTVQGEFPGRPPTTRSLEPCWSR